MVRSDDGCSGEVDRRCGRGDISCRPIQEGTSLYISMAYCEGEECPNFKQSCISNDLVKGCGTVAALNVWYGFDCQISTG